MWSKWLQRSHPYLSEGIYFAYSSLYLCHGGIRHWSSAWIEMDEKTNLCTRPCSEHAVAQRSLFIMSVGMSCMGTYYVLNTYYHNRWPTNPDVWLPLRLSKRLSPLQAAVLFRTTLNRMIIPLNPLLINPFTPTISISFFSSPFAIPFWKFQLEELCVKSIVFIGRC